MSPGRKVLVAVGMLAAGGCGYLTAQTASGLAVAALISVLVSVISQDQYAPRRRVLVGLAVAGPVLVGLAVAGPVLTGLVFVMTFIAVYGWCRHLNLLSSVTNRFFAVCVTVMSSALYMVVAIGVGVDEADGEARRAAEAARAGESPSPYFGLRGRLVCVRPLGSVPVPVENGPVTTGHPVLSFGASGDWIWLWDPERHTGDGSASAFAVRHSDV